MEIGYNFIYVQDVIFNFDEGVCFMSETVIRIPDLRVVFKEDVGAIIFPNIKEIPVSKLVETYLEFGNALRNMPGVFVNKYGEIRGIRQI